VAASNGGLALETALAAVVWAGDPSPRVESGRGAPVGHIDGSGFL
jgi:hypothetical protein